MALLKVITPDAQDFGEPAARLIKIASRGLLGDDRAQFVKRASAELASRLDRLLEGHNPDEPLIHLLAVGATEDFGGNRNGDGFRRSVCREYHPTFVKHAKLYRDHQNRNPAKSYGNIRDSWFNDKMNRIELVVGLNGTEKIAKANGGLLADKELQKLARHSDIPVSMACFVDHDVCSFCGNKAATRNEYCRGTHQGGQCKAGGLRDNIGKLIEIDGGVHQLHADNPHPKFFDISHVIRPADRIAYVSGLLKTAADSRQIVKSAELAEAMGLTVPFSLHADGKYRDDVTALIKLAYQLADMAADLTDPCRLAFHPAVYSRQPLPPPPDGQYKTAAAFRALADEQICLPLAAWLELTTGHPQEKVAAVVQPLLAAAYSRLLTDPDLPVRLANSRYAPAASSTPALRKWAADLASQFSLAPKHLVPRVARATIRGATLSADRLKTAAHADPSAVSLAKEYATYTLLYAGTVPANDFPLTASLLKLQNHVAS